MKGTTIKNKAAEADEIAPRQFKQEILTIRISTEGLNWLKEAAQKKEVAPSTLARMWILERLGQEDPPQSGSWV